MRLLYISNVKMPTNKAHGVHMIKMCEAFALQGIMVDFVVPMRISAMKEDPFEYYNVRKNFAIHHIFSIDLIKVLPVLGYWIQFVSFSIFAALRYAFASRTSTVVHTREYLIAIFFKILGFRVTYESHRVVANKGLYFKLVSFVDAIITNSRGVAEEFEKRNFKKVLALQNAVNISDFDVKESKEELRRILFLPTDSKIVMYSGHLYPWKGVDTVLSAAKRLPNNVKIICVGGTEGDVERYKQTAKEMGLDTKIRFLGHVKNSIIPKYLKAADILLLPNSPISEESIKYTSPMKLFEYMASKVPIIASDLPSIREVLDDENALLFIAGDEKDLADKIQKLLRDSGLADSISRRAYEAVKSYTWENRARKIIEFAHYI